MGLRSISVLGLGCIVVLGSGTGPWARAQPVGAQRELPAKGQVNLEQFHVKLEGSQVVISPKGEAGTRLVLPSSPGSTGATRELEALLNAAERKSLPLGVAWDASSTGGGTLKADVTSVNLADVLLGESGNKETKTVLADYRTSYLELLSENKRPWKEKVADYREKLTALKTKTATDMLRAAWGKDYRNALGWMSVVQYSENEERAVQRVGVQEDKALYGYRDVFKPPSYERLLRNLERVAGLFEGDPAVTPLRGAGVFVGPSVVLTAAHNLTPPPGKPVWMRPGRTRITVGRNAQQRDYVYTRKLLNGAELAPSHPAYSDLALIEVSPLQGAEAPAFQPMELGADNSGRAIYVLAFHDHDNRTQGIYDDAHVIFPHRVESREMGLVFQRAYANVLPRLPTTAEKEAALQRIVSEVSRAYGYSPAEDAPGRVYLLRTPSALLQSHPRFAYDTDTVHGNSGGGVFAKDTGELIGIMVSGMPDNDLSRQPSWDNKEMGVPVHSIRELFTEYQRIRRPAGDPPIDANLLQP